MALFLQHKNTLSPLVNDNKFVTKDKKKDTTSLSDSSRDDESSTDAYFFLSLALREEFMKTYNCISTSSFLLSKKVVTDNTAASNCFEEYYHAKKPYVPPAEFANLFSQSKHHGQDNKAIYTMTKEQFLDCIINIFAKYKLSNNGKHDALLSNIQTFLQLNEMFVTDWIQLELRSNTVVFDNPEDYEQTLVNNLYNFFL